jgi:hypothetical protein
MQSKFAFAFLFLLVLSIKSFGQPVYSGLRVAVYELEILQQKNQTLSLRCRMANTGQQTLETSKKQPEMVVEFDTLGLPGLLRGHEAEISTAVRMNCPKLKPGEISEPLWLNVRFQPQPMKDSLGCAEIIFDTVFVEDWGAREMRLHYFLKNTGTAPARFYAKNAEPLVNVYFVSGSKLTRGAIPAGSASIQKGRETLDGVLLPGQVLDGFVTIELENRSKFSPNIALEFDPAKMVEECGSAGNVWVLKLRY